MNEITLPPSPNWYCNNILVCSKRGTLAWGAKNNIVIAKQKEVHSSLQYSLIKDFCKDRVIALAFCPTLDSPHSPELLICGGDEDKVKIYNTDTLDLVTEFSFKDGKSIVGVDWSAKDNNLAYAVNSEGYLMYCYISYETYKIISLGKLTATCLACCPHDSNLVAIGAKSGLIYIVHKEKIIYKLRGHNEEIVSLSWCPSDANVLNENDNRDLLLASGAKDRSVFIWKAGGDGRYETVIDLPNVPLPYSNHKGKLNTNGTWIAVCWAKPKMLLTASLWGELLSWDLSTNKSKPMCKLFHTYHSRGLFCIAAVPKNDAISDNEKTDSELTVWTLAQDRWLICCKENSNPTKSAILKYKIPTQGGFIYCIGACPIDTSRIIFGVGDAMLRLWNLSESHTKIFDVTTNWQKIKGKIRAVSWFPDDESTVAFGTGEGRIGVFEAIGTNKPPLLYRQYHRNVIYKLEWAKLELDYFLFSCAEGELVAYEKSHPDNKPVSIIPEGCTEFSWKSNLCLAIALENGSIMFYDQKLKKRGNSIHFLRSMVNCLVWHPESTATDEWTSSTANYLAVASDSNIIILDMSKLIKKMETSTEDNIQEEDNTEKCILHKTVATLNGHFDKVVCLAWSPHFSGHLVSGSYDNVAQVWNVEKKELMGTFIGHNGPVLCCMWSPLKPQLIITGSSDFMLHVWNFTLPAQSPKQLSDIKILKRKQKQQKPQKKSKNKMDETQNNSTMPNSQPVIYNTKSEVVPLKKKEKSTYFNDYSKITNDKFKVLNFIASDIRGDREEEVENDTIANLSLFARTRYQIIDVINHEKLTQNNSNSIIEMDMWYGNLENNLMRAVKDQELNEFLVSLAPSISMKLWREMCEAYAHQLIRQGNVEKAVSYLLSIHKIYEAIEVFFNANMFKEAYVLARCNLDSHDPFIDKVLDLWSEWAVLNGRLEEAAHCCVQLEHLEKAAKILARRKDVHCLEIASELAFLNGDEGYGTSLIIDAVTRALIKSDWSKARSLIANLRQIQYLNVYIDAHEAIMSMYKEENELDTMRMWLEKKENHGVLQTLKMKYDTSFYDILCKNENINAILKNETRNTMMQLNACYRIAIAATCDSEETRLKHLATLLGDVFESEKIAIEHGTATNEKFFINILSNLDIKKPTDEGSIYAKSNYPVSQSIRAHLCIGLLNWLLSHDKLLINQLLIDKEIQIMNLILDLLNDAINDTTVINQNKICKLNQLEDQLLTLLTSDNEVKNNKHCKKMKEEVEKLKLDKEKLREERVCMPNPKTVFDKAYSLVDKLNDINRFPFVYRLAELEVLFKVYILKPFDELTESVSKETLENI